MILVSLRSHALSQDATLLASEFTACAASFRVARTKKSSAPMNFRACSA